MAAAHTKTVNFLRRRFSYKPAAGVIGGTL